MSELHIWNPPPWRHPLRACRYHALGEGAHPLGQGATPLGQGATTPLGQTLLLFMASGSAIT